MGKCELSRFEDLGLVQACEYSELDEKMMRQLFKDESEIPVDLTPQRPGESTQPILNGDDS